MTKNVIFCFDPTTNSCDVSLIIREKFKILYVAYLQHRISREAGVLVRDHHSYWLNVVLPRRILLALGNVSDQYLFGSSESKTKNQTGFAGFIALLEEGQPKKLDSILMDRTFWFTLLKAGQINICIFDGERVDEKLMTLWNLKLKEKE